MDLEKLKNLAALRAVEFVKSGMRIGLGSGSTAKYAIIEIGKRLRSGEFKDIIAVATSIESEKIARENGIKVVELDEKEIDLTIDGADEISPDLDLIKGLGAALLREKMIEIRSKEFIVIADYTKIVSYLGEKTSVPIEIVQFGFESTILRITEFGKPVLRTKNSQAIITDNGNFIADLEFSTKNVSELDQNLKQLTGVVETGFFLGMANRAFIAFDSEIKELSK